jgi:hypothetical protein
LSTGIVATAIVLIIGYIIVSKIVGLAFRLVVPLALVVLLGGAGVVSDLMPERSADSYAPYGEAQHRPAADIGDLRLRDVADMVVDGVRSVLRGSLDLLNGLSDLEPGREQRWPEEPEPTRHHRPYEPQPGFTDDPRRDEPRSR